MAEDASWHFPGKHPLAGEKKGLEEVVAFFDVMSTFKMNPQKYVTGVNDDYMIESQKVNSPDGTELEWCVLWSFADGKIIKGTHFSADQHRADGYFTKELKARNS